MSEKNLTNNKYPNLPDAPSLITLNDMNDASAYHTGYGNKEQFFMTIAQIRLMAINFVSDSDNFGYNLNFKKESLEHLDSVIESFKGKDMDPNNLEVFVAEAGSYFGVVLEKSTRQCNGKWYPCFKQYWFSSYRFEKTVNSGDSVGKKVLVETFPYAQLTKRLVSIITEKDDGSPSMVEYYNLLMSDVDIPA